MSSKCPFHNTENITQFDALDEGARANPWPHYDWLRENAPKGVYKLPQEEAFYIVHRYEDVKNIFNDTENYSSQIIPTKKSPFFALMDGSDHERIRSVVMELFAPSELLKHQTNINEIIFDSTNKLLNTDNAELFKLWADKIPLTILSEMFGMDTSDKAISSLHEGMLSINKALFVVGGTGPRRKNKPTFPEKIIIAGTIVSRLRKVIKLRRLLGKESFNELLSMFAPTNSKEITPRPNFNHIPTGIDPFLNLLLFFAEVLTSKNTPKNNAIIKFREAIAKKSASLTEMMMAGAFILFAGYETTSSLLSNCFVHLARNKSLLQELKNQPEKIDEFVEESLRYYTPVGRFLRRTKRDVVINGFPIPAKAIVILLPGAANTDPDKFENGCKFEPHRTQAKQHLSFGKGAHYCVGAPLARMQIITALRELLNQADELCIDESTLLKMVTNRDNGILRYEQIPVKRKSNKSKLPL